MVNGIEADGALELRFPSPNRPRSENEVRRMHWAQSHRVLKPWKEWAHYAWVGTGKDNRDKVRNVPCIVEVTLPFPTNAHRDPSNYVGTVVKAIVDGLKAEEGKAGIWPDDGPEWVTVVEPICVKGGEVIIRLIPRH